MGNFAHAFWINPVWNTVVKPVIPPAWLFLSRTYCPIFQIRNCTLQQPFRGSRNIEPPPTMSRYCSDAISRGHPPNALPNGRSDEAPALRSGSSRARETGSGLPCRNRCNVRERGSMRTSRPVDDVQRARLCSRCNCEYRFYA